jgi:hypothetical protein
MISSIMVKTQRIRDPVHGLIVFRHNDPLAQVAWKLLNTPEFQRLRRIKQLGFSELVFPGATHTRFAHCIGVFETARMLVGIIEREAGQIEQERADVAVLAAFARGLRKRHEEWTAQMIRDPNGNILPILEDHRPGLAEAIADLLVAETPADIYHAIVSSSFDADRLDYLRRDRLMTGSGAGVAAPVLGARDPRRSGLCGSLGLRPYQPGEAWSGGTPGRLAAFVVSSVRGKRAVSRRVDGRQRGATRDGLAAAKPKRRRQHSTRAGEDSPFSPLPFGATARWPTQ